MGLSQLFEAIDRFFLDIIGTIIPGAATFCGVWILFDVPNLTDFVSVFPPTDLFDWVLFVAGSYVAGYAVIGLGETLVLRIVDNKATEWIARKLRCQPIVFEKQLLKNIEESPEYLAVVEEAKKRYGLASVNGCEAETVRSWRNIALSIARDNSYLAWRFMFISLLNLGMATSVLMLVGLWVLSFVPNVPFEVSVNPDLRPWMFFLLVVTAVLFMQRRYQFYAYSMKVPFTMAIVKLHENSGEIR